MNISCFTLDSAISKVSPGSFHRQMAFRSILTVEGLVALELLLTLGIFSCFSLGKGLKRKIISIYYIPNS